MASSTRTTRGHDVTSITHQDPPPVAAMLPRAFAHDPVVAWSIPGSSRREARIPEHFSAILDLYVPKGHVDADARQRSVSCGRLPGTARCAPASLPGCCPACRGSTGTGSHWSLWAWCGSSARSPTSRSGISPTSGPTPTSRARASLARS